MAGDWIKMRTDLDDDPAVIRMAAALATDEFSIVGRLHKFWSWLDRQSRDGHATGVTHSWLDRYVRCDGFAEAMVAVGWLALGDDGLSIPNFERHNGETAKTRALGRTRKRRQRGGTGTNVTQESRNERDENGTREEKRREEKRRESADADGAAVTDEVTTFPSRDDLARIAAALEPTGMMVGGGQIAQWNVMFGAKFVGDVVEDVGPSLVGKGPSYLHAILRERHAAGWTPRQAKPAAVYSEPTPRKVTVDDVRHLQWLVSHPENYDPPAPGCTLDDVRDYLEAVVRDGEIGPDAKPIDEWIRRTA